MLDFNDEAIRDPDDDLFAIDPFAKAIAECIEKIPSPCGSVVAINGPWGSGKSSAINLVLHHLEHSCDAKPATVSFQAWRYRSEDALAAAFLRELHLGLRPALSKSKGALAAMRKLAARVSSTAPLVGSAIGAIVGSAAGRIAETALNVLGRADDCDEDLQDTVAEALRGSDRRFHIVIDDIDRFAPGEALTIFRLIKSVGRLPNVIYLLAYDRHAAEKAVEEQYPSEGSRYLEKIVQAAFELPRPGSSVLTDLLNERLNAIFGNADLSNEDRLQQLFERLVLPEIRTPRDVIRLSYGLSITYPALRGEVDIGDFIALETLRLFRPSVHSAIRSQRSLLVAPDPDVPGGDHAERAQRYDRLFLDGLSDQPEELRARLRTGLVGLFPQLASAWGSAGAIWDQRRRVCSEPHFDTYFRFALSSHTVPISEVMKLIRRTDDPELVRRTFRAALGERLATGRTKASVLLDELTDHAADFDMRKVCPFLQALYSIADDLLRVESDESRSRGFVRADNRLRLI